MMARIATSISIDRSLLVLESIAVFDLFFVVVSGCQFLGLRVEVVWFWLLCFWLTSF